MTGSGVRGFFGAAFGSCAQSESSESESLPAAALRLLRRLPRDARLPAVPGRLRRPALRREADEPGRFEPDEPGCAADPGREPGLSLADDADPGRFADAELPGRLVDSPFFFPLLERDEAELPGRLFRPAALALAPSRAPAADSSARAASTAACAPFIK